MRQDPRDNYKRCSARVASRDWRLNEDGVIEDMVRQVQVGQRKKRWAVYNGTLGGFMEFPVRRVIWVPRK